MTKAQEVKKALKGFYQVITCTNGLGSAWGWVSLKVKVTKDYDSNWALEQEVTKILKDAGIELYTYSDDMGGDKTCLMVEGVK